MTDQLGVSGESLASIAPETLPNPEQNPYGSAVIAAEYRPVATHQLRVREERHEQHPGEKSAHVRPHRHAARHVRIHLTELRQALEHLQPKPVEQHEPSADGNHENDEEHVDPRLRI